MVANRITFRLKSAIQDLGRALGMPPELRGPPVHARWAADYGFLRPHRAREAEPVFSEVLGEAPIKEALLRLLSLMEPRFFQTPRTALGRGGVEQSAADPLQPALAQFRRHPNAGLRQRRC